MRKKRLFIVTGLLICVCIALFVFIKNRRVHQSENVYASQTRYVYDDNGMYYFKNGYLMFMDNTTGNSIPLCAKANCSHNSTDCDACYSDSYAQDIVIYDDMLYISYFTIEYYTDSAGELQDGGVTKIECCKKDGSGRKQIYQSGMGAVLSMLAVDGRLYYSAYVLQPGTENRENYYMSDNYLYCYDMDWGTTKELAAYPGDSTHYNAGLYLAESTDKERLYLTYEYATEEKNTDAEYLTEWITLDMKGNLLDKEVLPVNIWIIQIGVEDDGLYVKYTDDLYQYDLPTKVCIWRQDGTEEQLLELGNGSIKISSSAFRFLTGYYYYIDSDDENLKLFIDYDEERYYIAKSAVSEAHIVPDIRLIDKEKDVVYYDTTDYTGVAVGTTFSEDPTQLSCMKWSEFLAEYFEDYDGQEIEGLTIGGLDEDEFTEEE